MDLRFGDQIFFKNGNTITHTGLVVKADSTKVYTIEGNTSSASGVVANGGAVAKKAYDLNNIYIAGYGRPSYKEVKEMDKEEAKEKLRTILEEQTIRYLDAYRYGDDLIIKLAKAMK